MGWDSLQSAAIRHPLAPRRAGLVRRGAAQLAGMLARLLGIPPVTRRLLLVIWPFLAIVVVLVALGMASVEVLSAGRGYVEGESHWSKAQKEAVFFLTRYAATHSEEDYNRFLASLAVPQGDEKARIELDSPHPDFALARQGFIEGLNHPDDIPGMIWLFRHFRRVSYFDRSVTVWTAGDRYIAELANVGGRMRAVASSRHPDERMLSQLLGRVYAIDAELSPLEDVFSISLGEATRKTKLLLLVSTSVIATTLVLIGIALSRRMMARSEAFENALRLSEERFNLAVNGSNDGLWDWNLVTGNVYYSPRCRELLGHGDGEIGHDIEALVSRMHPEDRQATRAALDTHLADGTLLDVEYRLKCASGEYRWFRMRGQSVRNDAGVPVRMAGSVTDITERKLAEVELFTEKERAQVTLASIGDAVVTTDMRGLIEYVNPAAEQLIGCRGDEARGLPLAAVFGLLDETTREATPDPIESVIREGRAVEVAANVLLLRRDGTEISVDESAAPIRDRSGRITGVVLVLRDVSSERQYAAKLSYQASHDALTGLINRREFEHRLTQALASAAGSERQHAVLYLDLDQFKVVNDTCGHAAGDELIRQIAVALQQRLREADTLARLGGDEFGVLLENCPPGHASRIAETLRQTLVDRPFVSQNRSFAIGASVGVVNLADGPFTLAEVLRAADAACYMAKEKGRNRVQIYHPKDSELSLRQGEMEWVARIHRALDEGRFRLYAQHIVDLRRPLHPSGHFELLVRMIDERGELVPPMAFIPAAERYNLMPMIDRWVVGTALSTLRRLRASGRVEDLETCCINLSGTSIGDERFLELLQDLLTGSGVPPASICFEVTETAAIANLTQATHFIEELRALGCRFALDDFGAGMASFAYLKHLPVDFLKIDGSFVKDMLEDPIDRAMVEAINHIGHVMGKETIAEFVENEQTLAELRKVGVDFAQGYGVAKPVLFGFDESTPRPQPASYGAMRA